MLVYAANGALAVADLVTRKLRSRQGKAYNVCVLARSEAKARELLDDADSNTSNNDIEGGLNVVELNLVGDDKAGDEQLCEAIKGELAIRYCVEGGVKTSTRDESDSGGGSRRGYVDTLSNATGIVISVGTTAFPTKRWAGGNTPQAIDQEAVSRIANLAASNCPSLRRMVLLTSVGVYRTDQMPFLILNLFGVLDAKRSGENAVKAAASEGNFSYSIVRPGRLVGGPYTNLDLAKLFQIEGGAENGVTVDKGDTLLGDCKRDACAEAVVQCLENESCLDVEFSMISNEEMALTTEQWGEAFVGMR
ncbi:predicted protein [Thalassiosira pseudonana CCMP1335]|uniref:Uncharacterized protein n=1 Tax=Thalassiosira pseudonana TaxID=35128 RepID=B8CG33_THAPS|nr:predicted protein [Thalassiosira pseudonana CCMP1335]EED87894.1 predicted protein [Thalassiosira pseudonana CCMP1335]